MPRYPRARWTPSPEYSPGRAGQPIIAVVEHSAVGPRSAVIERFTTNPDDPASTTFLICKDGTVDQFVDTADTPFANGTLNRNGGPDPRVLWLPEYYRVIDGVGGPNRVTISVEYEGGPEGNTTEPLNELQYMAAVDLHRWIFATHPLRPPRRHDTIVEHNQISATACPSNRVPVDRLVADLTRAPTPTKPTDRQLMIVARLFNVGVQSALDGVPLPPAVATTLKSLIP